MKDNSKDIKIILIGEEKVGKTSIFSRICCEQFHYSYESTRLGAINDKYIQFDEHFDTIKLVLWDTPGKQNLREITPVKFNNFNVVFIVFNISNKNSYIEAIDYWFKTAKEYQKNEVIICLVANYCEVDEAYEVSIEELTRFANENNVQLYMISALHDIGIKEMIKDITSKYMQLNSNYKLGK